LMSKWLDPLARERVDHLVAGLLCLLVTALAVVASLVTGIPIIRALGQ
jgi:hypothetical protein